MATHVVLEVPEAIKAEYDFCNKIVCIEHRKDPIIFYGSKVTMVSLDPAAEKLGVFLGIKPIFGNLYQFLILFEGVAHIDEYFLLRGVIPWSVRSDGSGLIDCGAGRVYVAPTLIAPLPILR